MQFPRLSLLSLASGLLFLAGCEENTTAPAAIPPPQVTVSTPLVQSIVDWDNYVGQFEAVERVEIRPRVSGYLVETGFEDGQQISAGDLLFRIDPRPFEAALNEAVSRVNGAKTRLNNASREYERAGGLVELQAVSQEEYDRLQTAVDNASSDLAAAEAAMEAAQLNVDFTSIRAPVSGRVSYRRADVGNAVKADDTILTTIVSVDPIHFAFHASESLYLNYMRRKSDMEESNPQVRIRLQDEQEYHWQGRLDFLDNAIDAASGTIRGRAVLDNPDGFLVPGMFGQMQLQASGEYEGLLLPDTAIATQGAQRVIYLVGSNGTVDSSLVTLGPLHEGLRIIRSGLSPDDRVIINGLQRVRPGMMVDAIPGEIIPQAGSENSAVSAGP